MLVYLSIYKIKIKISFHVFKINAAAISTATPSIMAAHVGTGFTLIIIKSIKLYLPVLTLWYDETKSGNVSCNYTHKRSNFAKKSIETPMINKNIIIKPFFHLQIYQILSLHKILLLHRNIWSKIVTLKGIFYEIK